MFARDMLQMCVIVSPKLSFTNRSGRFFPTTTLYPTHKTLDRIHGEELSHYHPPTHMWEPSAVRQTKHSLQIGRAMNLSQHTHTELRYSWGSKHTQRIAMVSWEVLNKQFCISLWFLDSFGLFRGQRKEREREREESKKSWWTCALEPSMSFRTM